VRQPRFSFFLREGWTLRFVLHNPRPLGYDKAMKSFTLAFFQKAGKRGGSAKTKAKAAAARANGKLGGRPRKKGNK
jgi:hypothetical protein